MSDVFGPGCHTGNSRYTGQYCHRLSSDRRAHPKIDPRRHVFVNPMSAIEATSRHGSNRSMNTLSRLDDRENEDGECTIERNQAIYVNHTVLTGCHEQESGANNSVETTTLEDPIASRLGILIIFKQYNHSQVEYSRLLHIAHSCNTMGPYLFKCI